MPRKRAMTSEKASEVKVSGHLNEEHFATIIGGSVNLGSQSDKKDVRDAQDRFHSVKAGTWWQIFLYGRERFEKNTIFQGLGQLAEIMIACIDAYPPNREDYLANKEYAKQRLQPQMRRLLAELQNPRIFNAFLSKSLFDGGNADYLSIFLGPARSDIEEKTFHIFHKDDVVPAIANGVDIRNSRARNINQFDDQKVTFKSKLHRRNIGEIEDRHDSKQHYREMKFRLHAQLVFELLVHHIGSAREPGPQILTYGKASRLFRVRTVQ